MSLDSHCEKSQNHCRSARNDASKRGQPESAVKLGNGKGMIRPTQPEGITTPSFTPI
jgi:hypothetical protein